jgi:CubicO group peptidase (beta-lactamase class C family)
MKSTPSALLAVSLLLAMSTAHSAPPDLDQLLGAAVERGDAPGLVVMAGDRQGVLFQGAYGRAESGAGRGMTLDAIFRIASMTKAVTSVAVMQLVEAGRLGLDDPAAKYVPELANVQVFESFDAATGSYRLRAPRSPITVRQLLTHTSGLGYSFVSPILKQFKPREGETHAYGPLLFDPGTDWHYGTSTDVLGRIVEKLAGRDLETHFKERILGPLGLHDTSYTLPPEKFPRLVNLHRRRAAGGFDEDPRTQPTPPKSFSGGGGLYSTARDYLRFLRMLLNDGELDGVRILAPDTVAQMARNHIGELHARAHRSTIPDRSRDFSFTDEAKDKWGLGFQIAGAPPAGRRSPGSLGWAGIFNTYFWVDPTRGVAGVILMQFYPFADLRALAVYDTFERGVYERLGRP